MGKLGRLGAQMMTEAKAITQNAKAVRQGQILPSDKRDSGYFGRIEFRFDDAADEIWSATFRMIMSEMPEVSSAVIRHYLDSKSGAEFGDVVATELKKTLPTPDSTLYGKVMQPKMSDVKRIVKSVFGNNVWIRKQIESNAKIIDVPTSGTIATLEKLVGSASEALELAKQQEQKKNWKERDAAMHALQTEADRLATAARAWLAQRR